MSTSEPRASRPLIHPTVAPAGRAFLLSSSRTVFISVVPCLSASDLPPILDEKDPSSPSIFRPAALLREARRQKGLPAVDVPAVCILDPDGDIVRRLRTEGRSK